MSLSKSEKAKKSDEPEKRPPGRPRLTDEEKTKRVERKNHKNSKEELSLSSENDSEYIEEEDWFQSPKNPIKMYDFF